MVLERDTALLTLQLFGTFQARQGDTPLPGLHRREGERLLAFLVLQKGEPVASRELAQRFWPAEAQLNMGEQGDFPNVRQAIRALRQALGANEDRLSRPTRATVQLDLTDIDTDVVAFDRLAKTQGQSSKQSFREAIALYRGELLAGWDEPWVLEARRQRQRAYESLLRHLGMAAWQENDTGDAERWLRLLLASRPGDEEATRTLTRLFVAAERFVEASETLERFRETGKEPHPETQTLAGEVRRHLESGRLPQSPLPVVIAHDLAAALPALLALETAGGAVPVESAFYIVRDTDAAFQNSLTKRDSIVLVKGARQVGKTSLLARGLHYARQAGARVILTDFQKLNASQLTSPDTLYFSLACSIVRQLELPVSPRDVWEPDLGPNMNMELFLQSHVLPAVPEHLIWGMDEVDRLFTCSFGSEVFGLFRSWHNERALNPSSPLSRLTLAIAYATEAHLFITDLNQSPFNVGTRLALSDFNAEQIADLNRRYGSPFTPETLARFEALVGGQPFLVRAGLDQAATGTDEAEQVFVTADGDEGIFADHLRRLLFAVSRAPHLVEALRGILAGQGFPKPDDFYRLRAAGILSGAASQQARFRCPLYASYFARHLG